MWLLGARIRVQTSRTRKGEGTKVGLSKENTEEWEKDGEQSFSKLSHDSGNNSLLDLVVQLMQIMQVMQPRQCWSSFHLRIVNANTTELTPEPCSWVLCVFSGQYNYGVPCPFVSFGPKLEMFFPSSALPHEEHRSCNFLRDPPRSSQPGGMRGMWVRQVNKQIPGCLLKCPSTGINFIGSEFSQHQKCPCAISCVRCPMQSENERSFHVYFLEWIAWVLSE